MRGIRTRTLSRELVIYKAFIIHNVKSMCGLSCCLNRIGLPFALMLFGFSAVVVPPYDQSRMTSSETRFYKLAIDVFGVVVCYCDPYLFYLIALHM